MLRASYYLLLVVVLLGACQATIGYKTGPVIPFAPLIADGPGPEAPPIPLAVPGILVADGPGPEAPPIPLAAPDLSRKS